MSRRQKRRERVEAAVERDAASMARLRDRQAFELAVRNGATEKEATALVKGCHSESLGDGGISAAARAVKSLRDERARAASGPKPGERRLIP